MTCPPAGYVAIVWLMAPVPEAAGHTAPLLALHVQLLKLAMPAGTGSAMTVPLAATLLTFCATTVKVTVAPGTSVEVDALFWMLTIGTGEMATAAVHGPGLLPGGHTPPFGGDAVAVLVTSDGGFDGVTAVIEYVTAPPGGNAAMVSYIAPLPLAFGQTAPPAAAQVQVELVRPNGIGSLTTVPFAPTLPVFVTTTV